MVVADSKADSAVSVAGPERGRMAIGSNEHELVALFRAGRRDVGGVEDQRIALHIEAEDVVPSAERCERPVSSGEQVMPYEKPGAAGGKPPDRVGVVLEPVVTFGQ